MNKQLVCKETKNFETRETEIPAVPNGGLIVKVEYAGVCHSDAHMYAEENYKILMPRIFGHEIAGTVYKLGDDYKEGKLKVGDNVVVFPWGGCRKCKYCEMNEICVNRNGPHAHTYGVWRDGGFQQYVALEDSWSAIPVPDGIPMDVASLVPCSGISAYNALVQCQDSITRAIKVRGQANIFVMGAGGLALWAIEFAKSMYGDKIKLIAADINEEKLTVAKKTGADGTLLVAREGESKVIAGEITKAFGSGVDAAIDFVNSSVTMERIFYSTTNNSTMVMVGLNPSKLPPLEMQHFILKGIRVQGIYAGSWDQVQEVFQLLLNGQVKGPEISSVTLNDVEKTLNDMLQGSLKASRAVVDMKTS